MENLSLITDATQLAKVFENAYNKLVVCMFYTKNNPDCRKSKSYFENSSINHMTSLFCIVDMDKFEGDSRYVKNVSTMPKFEFFYCGNSIGCIVSSNDREIEEMVRVGERYILTQSNMKNNNVGQNINTMSQSGQINTITQMQAMQPLQQLQPMQPMQFSQAQIQQVQQQIINNAMMQNPVLANQLLANPTQLQAMALQQLQAMAQQQNMQQQQTYQQQIQPIYQQQLQQFPQQQQQQTIPQQTISQQTIPQNIESNIYNKPTNNQYMALPTMQQMQQMFQIFQMMQKMGVLNTDTLPQSTLPNSSSSVLNNNTVANSASIISNSIPHVLSQTNVNPQDDKTTILPNGDKIIPLGNGKYGLIKKN